MHGLQQENCETSSHSHDTKIWKEPLQALTSF